MDRRVYQLLNQDVVVTSLLTAWLESNPGLTGGHEEGGFIVKEPTGEYAIHRWPRGTEYYIDPSEHPNCHSDSLPIIASFHTHPNIGTGSQQSPGKADIRAVRDDPDLKATHYLGEFVISNAEIYLVAPDGVVHNVGATGVILRMT
ncbi:hypothetical protein BH11PLA2_BH11PLA2_15710 [soil metagenome]